MKMELILQSTFETCGQACVAMITGKAIEEVIKDMKTSGSTSIGQLIEILVHYEWSMRKRTCVFQKRTLCLMNIPY